MPAPFAPQDQPFAPNSLDLIQAFVLVRHGERTPVRHRLTKHIPETWNLCHEGRAFDAAVLELSPEGKQGRDELGVFRRLERLDGKLGARGDCLLGELTDVGRRSTLEVGRMIRALYIDQLGLVPSTLSESSLPQLYFRSTNMPRTVESLQQLMTGLYPRPFRAEGIRPDVLTRDGMDETLLPNTMGCRRLGVLWAEFAKAAAKKYNPTLHRLDEKLSLYLDGEPVRIDGRPRANGILDTVRAAQAHGIPVPSVFADPAVQETLEKAVTHEWFDGYTSPEFRRISLGPLLASLSGRLSEMVGKGKGPKLGIMATHDTTLAGVLACLDVFNNRWPDFTAHIALELFRPASDSAAPSSSSSLTSWFRRSQSTSHYVRLRYQSRPLTLPACAADGDHLPGFPEFCTLEAFQRAVQKVTPRDWTEECRVSGGSSE